jgi:hypothetical protein
MLTIGDVLPSLPAESLAQSRIDPATPLPLRRETVEQALRSGQASLPVYEIYQAVPELFSRPVAPNDARRVSLPPDKIVKLMAWVGTPPSAGASVFSIAGPSGHAAAGSSDSKDPVSGLLDQQPVWIAPKSNPPSDSVASTPTPSSLPSTSAKSSPFSLAEKTTAPPAHVPSSSAPATNPFDRISAMAKSNGDISLSSAPEPPPATEASKPASVSASASPFAMARPTLSASSTEKVRLPLPVALQFCTEEDLGIEPSLLPDSVEVSLPQEVFHRQLASGDKPCVRLAEIRLGLIPEHKVLLAAARPELKIRLPVDLFESTPFPPQENVVAAATAAASPPIPVQAKVPVQASAPPAAPAAPPTPTPAPAHVATPAATPPAIPSSFLMDDGSDDSDDPFAEMPMIPDWNEAESNALNNLADSPFDFPPLPGLSEPTASPSKPQSNPEPSASFPLAPAAPPVAAPKFNSFKIQDTTTPPPPFSLNQPDPPAKQPRSRVTSARPGSKHRRLLLRVLLGTHEDLDAEGAIQKICKLPGVAAVACIRNNALFSSASDGSSEALAFIDQAIPLQQHLLPISQVSGLENTEIITLRSEQRLVSFALNSSLTLGILHTPSPHETELLERVTLLTTELAAMLASNEG